MAKCIVALHLRAFEVKEEGGARGGDEFAAFGLQRTAAPPLLRLKHATQHVTCHMSHVTHHHHTHRRRRARASLAALLFCLVCGGLLVSQAPPGPTGFYST